MERYFNALVTDRYGGLPEPPVWADIVHRRRRGDSPLPASPATEANVVFLSTDTHYDIWKMYYRRMIPKYRSYSDQIQRDAKWYLYVAGSTQWTIGLKKYISVGLKSQGCKMSFIKISCSTILVNGLGPTWEVNSDTCQENIRLCQNKYRVSKHTSTCDVTYAISSR